MTRHDVAIVGSGFAGAILARALRRRGRSVLLLERGRHPRFAIGESTTPLANLALERLAARYDLPDLHHLATYGRWLEHLPALRRGKKRGFTFYRHHPGVPYRNTTRNEARLLVAASPEDALADTHWLRSDVDHHLVKRAVAEGVDYRDGVELDGALPLAAGLRLEGRRDGRRARYEAGFVVDAGGPSGFLRHALEIPDAPVPFSSALLYSHFKTLGDFVDLARRDGAVLDSGPYPDECAAVHHVLDGGWLYVLPFDHGPASVGLVLLDGLRRDPAAGLGSETLRRDPAAGPGSEALRRDPAAGFSERLRPYPTLAAQFAAARPLRPVRYVERIQHRLARAAGERWCLLPHGYAFYDPMFSTGIAWSLAAVERLAAILADDVDAGALDRYARRLAAEADQIERLVESAYLALADFDLLVSVAYLYFATVAHAEIRQRLDPGAAARSPFLDATVPDRRALFAAARDRLRALAGAGPVPREETRAFHRFVMEKIAPIDLVGLDLPDRRRLHPVDVDLLLDRAPLLGASREEVAAVLPTPASAVSS